MAAKITILMIVSELPTWFPRSWRNNVSHDILPWTWSQGTRLRPAWQSSFHSCYSARLACSIWWVHHKWKSFYSRLLHFSGRDGNSRCQTTKMQNSSKSQTRESILALVWGITNHKQVNVETQADVEIIKDFSNSLRRGWFTFYLPRGASTYKVVRM